MGEGVGKDEGGGESEDTGEGEDEGGGGGGVGWSGGERRGGRERPRVRGEGCRGRQAAHQPRKNSFARSAAATSAGAAVSGMANSHGSVIVILPP